VPLTDKALEHGVKRENVAKPGQPGVLTGITLMSLRSPPLLIKPTLFYATGKVSVDWDAIPRLLDNVHFI
jgi:hypothetical protein